MASEPLGFPCGWTSTRPESRPSSGPEERVRTVGPVLDDELGAQADVGVVEVAPPLAPDRRALGPPVAVAGERHLEPLGEGGLAGAVAPDDKRQAGAGGELEGGLGPDAPEPLDRDASEVGADGGGGRRRGAGLKDGLELIGARREDVVGGVVGDGGSVAPVEDEFVRGVVPRR